MRRFAVFLATVVFCTGLFGCAKEKKTAQIAATTLPVYEFTAYLCHGADICVTRLITENVSCLHDYSLKVDQMRTIEGADLVVTSGAGLEEFMEDALSASKKVIDASEGITLICGDEEHDRQDGHSHENDPHIWLSPSNAKSMAHNICNGLITAYPQYADVFRNNLKELDDRFDDLSEHARQELSNLSTREIITFHDGFSYMAQAFDLTILHAIEEESGAEASAAELIDLIKMVQRHKLDTIFIEANSNSSAASIISAETGAKIYTLDMATAGYSYFEAMYHNIDILKEALQ